MLAILIFSVVSQAALWDPRVTDWGSDEDLQPAFDDVSCLERMAACPDSHSCPIGVGSGIMTEDSVYLSPLVVIGSHRTAQSRKRVALTEARDRAPACRTTFLI